MPRARKGAARHRSKKRILRQAKGYRGGRSKLWRSAKEAVVRAGVMARAGRRIKKRDYRSLWVTRLSAACGQHGVTYSRFICGLKRANVVLNRKMLSELAIHDGEAFEVLVKLAREKIEQAA
ncbi:MAG: 50S ribosomal protein L20 [Phycisphaerae bacterium]|nr:50S ribosomal protein L20 [Phycisphaerae bacterium]